MNSRPVEPIEATFANVKDFFTNIKDKFEYHYSNRKHTTKRRSRGRQEEHRTVGKTIRDVISFIDTLIGPLVKIIMPNFIHVHYFYIIMSGIVTSILLYGPRNMSYIDCFFMGYGAVTQAGLNTVNVNQMNLYQQLVLYFCCALTTPIFIHGTLVFVRLYWFEKTFDGIKTSSKLNFKMRKEATLAARTTSMDPSKTNENNTMVLRIMSRFSKSNEPTIHAENESNNQNNSTKEESENTSSLESANNYTGNTEIPLQDINVDGNASLSSKLPATPTKDIRFGSTPALQHTAHVNPRDMYMSIAMMRQKNNEQIMNGESNNNDEEGPVLIVKGPAEREQHRFKRLHRRSSSFQLGLPKWGLKKEDKYNNAEHRYDDNVLESGNESDNESGRNNNSEIGNDESDEADNSEIDNSEIDNSEVDNSESDEADNSDIDAPDNNELDEHESVENSINSQSIKSNASNHIVTNKYIRDVSDGSSLQKLQSNFIAPSADQTGGLKYMKRAATLDTELPYRKPLIETLDEKKPELKTTFKENKPNRAKRKARATKKLTKTKSRKLAKNLKKVGKYPSMMLDDLSVSESRISNKIHRQMSAAYLSFNPTFGRNSTFVPLDHKQKEELGGVEYRSLKLLAKILIGYYVGFHLLALAVLGFWIIPQSGYRAIIRADGANPAWWSAFTAGSFFNDLGLTLTPDSFSSFVNSRYVLLWGSFFITIGNVAFPIMLRFIIWMLFKLARDLSLFKESLGFLLDHPRRCFTLLFPSIPTWRLFFVLVVLNLIDLILFCILDIRDKSLDSLSDSTKVLAAFFQAISTRTAGFACIDLSKLHPAIQVSYMLMMYVSALPVAISIRRTNVYEEQSLGIYNSHDEDDDMSTNSNRNATKRFVGTHLRKQLSFDLWYIFLGLFIICIVESDKLRSLNDPYFTIFQVLFEVVSAYGCVGLSLGYPNDTRSFSAQFKVISKLVIVAMFVRGRHRGLPYAIDRAIILPSKAMDRRDGYQAHHLRRNSNLSTRNYQDQPISPDLEQWNNYHMRQQAPQLTTSDSIRSNTNSPSPQIANMTPDNGAHNENHENYKNLLEALRSPALPSEIPSSSAALSVPQRRTTISFDTDTSFHTKPENYQKFNGND